MIALAFFFVAVFGDGPTMWTENGPYSTPASCARNAGRYAAAWTFGSAIHATPLPATSECYAKEPR